MLAEVVLFFLFFFLAIGITLFIAKVLITNVQFLFIFLKYFRNVNYGANHHSYNGYKKYSPCGDVFNTSDILVVIWVDKICHFFYSCIDSFNTHYKGYGKQLNRPFCGGYLKVESSYYSDDGNNNLSLYAGLLFKKQIRPFEGVSYALDSVNYKYFQFFNAAKAAL